MTHLKQENVLPSQIMSPSQPTDDLDARNNLSMVQNNSSLLVESQDEGK